MAVWRESSLTRSRVLTTPGGFGLGMYSMCGSVLIWSPSSSGAFFGILASLLALHCMAIKLVPRLVRVFTLGVFLQVKFQYRRHFHEGALKFPEFQGCTADSIRKLLNHCRPAGTLQLQVKSRPLYIGKSCGVLTMPVYIRFDYKFLVPINYPARSSM